MKYVVLTNTGSDLFSDYFDSKDEAISYAQAHQKANRKWKFTVGLIKDIETFEATLEMVEEYEI